MIQCQERDDMDVDCDRDSDKESGSSDEGTESGSGSEDEGKGLFIELDEEEYERRKSEMSNEMADLEKQFVAIKEQLYYERLNQIDHKLIEAREERLLEYQQPLDELLEAKQTRMDVAEVLRQLRKSNIQCLYEAENYAAKQNFDMESRQLKEQLRQDLEDKLNRLNEDRKLLDTELFSESHPVKKKRRYTNHHDYVGPLGRDQLNLPDRRRKPIAISGPYVVYMLKEQDIMEDYKLIRQASKTTGSYYF